MRYYFVEKVYNSYDITALNFEQKLTLSVTRYQNEPSYGKQAVEYINKIK